MSKTVWQREGMAWDERMLVLFKLGEEKHLTSLRERGLLHMRTMRYFAQQEAGNLARGDRFEGASTLLQPTGLRMTFSHPVVGTHEVDPNDLVGPVILSLDHEAEQNIFCMFSLTEPSSGALLHPDHHHFGSHFVLILHTPEFLRRVDEAIKAGGLQGKAGPVEYYDEASYSGAVGAFRKSIRFAYQNEYRIVVWPGTTPSRDLEIGDLRGVTSPVLPLSDLDSLVDLSERSAIEGGWTRAESPE